MIKIAHKKLDQISLSYYRLIDKKIKKRLIEVEDVFQSIIGVNGKSVNDYSALSDKLWKTFKKHLNSMPDVDIQDQKALATWTVPVGFSSLEPVILGIIKYLKVKKNRKNLILCPAIDHEKTINDYYLIMGISSSNEDSFAPLLRRILDYSLINKRIAYDLTWGLNIRTCPYCNRIWINTIKNSVGGILRPTLDHFYSQSKYPLLGLSFYNLVPSCYNCNSSLKNADDFKVSTHIHPYIEGFEQDGIFSFTFNKVKKEISHPDNYSLSIAKGSKTLSDRELRIFGSPKTKGSGSVPMFKLAEVYQAHKDLLGELYVKTDENSPFYLTSIKDFLKQLNVSKEEFYRYHFHNYYDDENMNLRPLSKFTKDIVLERVPELRK